MQTIENNLADPQIIAFLTEHISEMLSVSPPESKHALDVSGLQHSSITFWSFWNGTALLGCGALKELSESQGEIKSMRTAKSTRKTGIGGVILGHIISVAKERGYKRLSLETGSMDFFIPARKFYEKHGFGYCPPFGDYKEDSNSVFMSLEL